MAPEGVRTLEPTEECSCCYSPAVITLYASGSCDGPWVVFWQLKSVKGLLNAPCITETLCSVQCTCQGCAADIMAQKDALCPLCRARIADKVVAKF